jgi:hypothetical protein
MAAPRKAAEKSPLQRIPTRKLVAGIKKDLRQMLKSEPVVKPKKGKA